MLYVVSTPIGHLKDITLRAIETLKSVDVIAAEDTRHTAILCKTYDITTPLVSNFEHNEQQKAQHFLQMLKEGKNIALVSDAGTPGICDPGFRLIRLAKEHQIPMTVIPGASAVISALTLSGLPSDQFIFKGFFPVKSGARRREIEQIKEYPMTTVFYESPHRLLKTLKDIEEVLHDPKIVVIREITKKFEERLEKKAGLLYEHFLQHAPKGEFVIVFHL